VGAGHLGSVINPWPLGQPASQPAKVAADENRTNHDMLAMLHPEDRAQVPPLAFRMGWDGSGTGTGTETETKERD
jgi:hypothetical protein